MAVSIQRYVAGIPVKLDGDMPAYTRVKFSATDTEYAFKVEKAGTTEAGLGIIFHPQKPNDKANFYEGTLFTYAMLGDMNMLGAGGAGSSDSVTYTAGTTVYAGANGTIATSGTIPIGTVLQTATVPGQKTKALPVIPALISSYTLPVASASALGGVKVGSGLEINDGVLSVAD